jgi:RNA polymerase sigma factor (sigma-70 family)
MQELDDNSLLREYVERDSQEAFAALVARHVSKVYSVALRHTRNPHHAEEIAQAVFVILARNASKLRRHPTLSGWLYQTARLTAVTFMRSEIRRAHREQEAFMQTVSNETESDIWPQIAPLLDAAIASLNETDRHAVVLRFFDARSMKEIGLALGTSEDAVKMRVNRAVEKLRLFFTRRGVVVSAATLTAIISANSVQAAPAALAKTATAVALTKGVTASTSTLTLIKGALKIMAWTKAKTTVVASVIVLLAAGTAIVAVEQTSLLSTVAAKGQSDADALQGTWTGHEINGAPGSSTLTIQGSNLEFRGANPNEWYKATFTLREDTTPKQLIAVITDCPAPQFVGKTSHAIYQLQGSTFTMAGNEPGKPESPSSFDAPGSRKFVFTKK